MVKTALHVLRGLREVGVPIFTRFANAWGKQWSGPGVAQCFAPRAAAQSLTLGGSAIECPDYSTTQCMLVWGCNPVNTWLWKAVGMMEAWARGAKLIAVDPVLSESASKADIWLSLDQERMLLWRWGCSMSSLLNNSTIKSLLIDGVSGLMHSKNEFRNILPKRWKKSPGSKK